MEKPSIKDTAVSIGQKPNKLKKKRRKILDVVDASQMYVYK